MGLVPHSLSHRCLQTPVRVGTAGQWGEGSPLPVPGATRTSRSREMASGWALGRLS